MEIVSKNCRNMTDSLGSEHKLWFRVDLLERRGRAFVENLLGCKALVFVKIVGSHTSSEAVDILSAELG